MKIKILSTGQVYNVENILDIKPGQEILVESEGIIEPAVSLCDKECIKAENEGKIASVVRVCTDEDKAFRKKLKTEVQDYLTQAKGKAFRHGLDMKILDAELSFDRKKLTFYFSAEGRVDFRSLVSDMVGDFGKIIRLQQVGPRDEAKHFGGFGKCGRPLCCSTFLSNLESVTLEMAEMQELSGSKPAKLAGCCGKLMCCLSYEADIYQNLKAKMPKIGSKIKTKEGEGKVVGHNLFEEKVIIETKDGKKIEAAI